MKKKLTEWGGFLFAAIVLAAVCAVSVMFVWPWFVKWCIKQ